MSNEIDYEALEALEKAATPGPWVAYRDAGSWIKVETPKGAVDVAHGAHKNNGHKDAALIAALRNAAPALIARAKEADELRAMLAEVWTELAYYAELKDMYDFTKAPDDDEVDVDVGDVRKLAVLRARIAEALK